MGRTPQENKMINLVKGLDFETKEDYYNYMAESHINGNFSQCKRLYSDLPKLYKSAAMLYLKQNAPNEVFTYYLQLI